MNPASHPGWNDQIAQLPGATIFHTANWANVLASSYNYKPEYFTSVQDAQISGCIPLMDIDSFITGRRGEQEKAIHQYSAALEKNPNQPGAHFLLGTLYQERNQADQAQAHYREALRIDPGFVPAVNNLAYMLADGGGDLDEALQYAQAAKKKLPDDPHVMDTQGWVYFKRGLYDTAIAEFSGSLEKLPDNAMIHYHLGMAFYKKGESDRARETFKRALDLDPEFPGADEAGGSWRKYRILESVASTRLSLD